MEPFKKSTESSFHLDQRLSGAVARLAVSASEAGVACKLPGAFPDRGTAVQKAVWLRRLLWEAGWFAEKCLAMGHSAGTPPGWQGTNAGQAIRLQLQQCLKGFANQPSSETWTEATRGAAELLLVLARIAPDVVRSKTERNA